LKRKDKEEKRRRVYVCRDGSLQVWF